jgi:hypothetical protein
MIILKIYEAHYLTLTAGPNLTYHERENLVSKLFLRQFIMALTKKSPGDVLLRRRFVTGDASLRRCFVKETLYV